MDCLELKEKVGYFLDHELDEHESQKIAQHLHSCNDCKLEVRFFERIESLAATKVLDSPPSQYWSHLPGIISKRIGLQQRVSWFASSRRFLTEMTNVRGFRIGLATGMAAFVGILLIRNLTDGNKPEQLSPSTIGVQVVQPTTTAVRDHDESLIGREEQPQIHPKEQVVAQLVDRNERTALTARSATTDFGESALPDRSMPLYLGGHVTAVSEFRPLTQPLYTHVPGSEEGLIPFPVSEMVASKDDRANEDEESTMPFQATSALRTDVPTSVRVQNRQPEAEAKQAENSFAETLWIVQQSPNIEEKKNIWLSFVSREQDPTYKSLGIYNLALVLAKIAEHSKLAADAETAYDFFIKHERSLRFQMREQRYNMKLNTLKMILAE